MRVAVEDGDSTRSFGDEMFFSSYFFASGFTSFYTLMLLAAALLNSTFSTKKNFVMVVGLSLLQSAAALLLGRFKCTMCKKESCGAGDLEKTLIIWRSG